MRDVNPQADGCVLAVVDWLGEFSLTCSGCLISPIWLPPCMLDEVYYIPEMWVWDREVLTFLLHGICHCIVQTSKESLDVCTIQCKDVKSINKTCPTYVCSL